MTSNLRSKNLFALNEDASMIRYGLIFFTSSMFNAPMYYVVITTIYHSDRRKPNFTYKLMNVINFLELWQGLGHLITSPVLIFPNLHLHLDVFVRIIGCLMNTCWIIDFPAMALLAVCRILIFCRVTDSRSLPIVIKIVLILVLSWGCFVFISGSILQNMKFSVPVWGYDYSAPYTKFFDTLELFLSFPCLVVSYIAYLTIIYLIYVKQRLKSSVQSRKNEMAILLHYTVVTIYSTCLIVVWHPALFTFVPFIDMENTRNQAILNWLWIVNCYINPVMMVLFNASIRQDILKSFPIKSWLVPCKSSKPATVLSIAP